MSTSSPSGWRALDDYDDDVDVDVDVPIDSLCFKCWHNHRPLPPQVAGEQGRAGADHRRADVEEGGHLEGA